ncbi:MAG: hypothetical protein [Siphoviridae sp. ctjeG17]|nr:MAG: hypothetical protein [Siphoviridae sp. ctjeG17]
MGKSYRMVTTFIGPKSISRAMCEYEGAYNGSPQKLEGQIKASPLPGTVIQRIFQPHKFNAPVLGNLRDDCVILDFDVADHYSKDIVRNRKERVIFCDVWQSLNVAAARNIPGLANAKRQIDELNAENQFLYNKLRDLNRKIGDYDPDYAAQEAARMADFTAMIKKKTTSFGDMLAQTRQPYQ